MTRARTVAEVIAGEAVSGTPEQRMADMRAIASVVANRAQMLGITPQEVVANSNEFNAYNRSLPPGVGQGIIDMAQEQIDYVAENGPVNNATFYATPAATGNLPSGLSYETETTGHQYFSDPQNRAIGSALGYIQPNQYGYAQNLTDVPTPTSSAGLLSDWSQMASEGPMTAPMGSVTAAGLLGAPSAMDASAQASLSLPTVNNYADMAAAGPFGGQYAPVEDRMGLLSQPSISQTDVDRAFFNATGASIDPSFTAGLMGPQNAVVPTAVETTSYTPSTAIAAADLGSMPDAYAAQRGPTTGLLSADAQTVQGQAEKQLYEQANTGLLSPAMAYAAEPATPPAVQAIENQMTPSQIAGYQQFAQNAPNITNMSGITGIFDDGTAYQNAMPAEVQAPDLQTVEVADQPSIATVEGPATTPALDQQEQQQAITAPTSTVNQTPSQSTLGSRLSKAINPGTIGGGLLGGLALGPAGGLVGGLLGNAAYNGSMSGLLGSSPMSINNIGGGLANTASIWGGGTPAGTQATASDGQTVTSMGNGYTALTNSYGTTTVFDGSGKPMSYFGGALGNDQDQDTEGRSSGGGFFGGLFG